MAREVRIIEKDGEPVMSTKPAADQIDLLVYGTLEDGFIATLPRTRLRNVPPPEWSPKGIQIASGKIAGVAVDGTGWYEFVDRADKAAGGSVGAVEA